MFVRQWHLNKVVDAYEVNSFAIGPAAEQAAAFFESAEFLW